MVFQIFLNSLIALLWQFLQADFTFSTFLIGYIIGIIMLFTMRRIFKGRFYLERAFSIVRLIVMFLGDVVTSSIAMSKVILAKDIDITPGIFKYRTVLESDWEVMLLTSLISLTPGTTCIEVDEDSHTFYIHCIDLSDPEEERSKIRNGFERHIVEVFRK